MNTSTNLLCSLAGRVPRILFAFPRWRAKPIRCEKYKLLYHQMRLLTVGKYWYLRNRIYKNSAPFATPICKSWYWSKHLLEKIYMPILKQVTGSNSVFPDRLKMSTIPNLQFKTIRLYHGKINMTFWGRLGSSPRRYNAILRNQLCCARALHFRVLRGAFTQ